MSVIGFTKDIKRGHKHQQENLDVDYSYRYIDDEDDYYSRMKGKKKINKNRRNYSREHKYFSTYD